MTISSVFRRFAPLALAGTLLLGACGASNALGKDEAFTINGQGYKTSDFNSIVDTLVANKQMTKTNGKVSASDLNSVLNVLIKFDAYKQFREKVGFEEDAALLKKIQDAADKDTTFAKYPKVMQELLIGLNVAEGTLTDGKIPASSVIKDLYEKSPASSGTLCISHILVKTLAQARAVLKDLAEGTSWKDEAKAKTIDPSGTDNGGALTDNGNTCQTLVNAQAVFDADFVRGAIVGKAGVPTGPVKTQFGYHIILNAAYDDVAKDIETALAKNPLQYMLNGFMATSDVRIASTYGKWDAISASIK